VKVYQSDNSCAFLTCRSKLHKTLLSSTGLSTPRTPSTQLLRLRSELVTVVKAASLALGARPRLSLIKTTSANPSLLKVNLLRVPTFIHLGLIQLLLLTRSKSLKSARMASIVPLERVLDFTKSIKSMTVLHGMFFEQYIKIS